LGPQPKHWFSEVGEPNYTRYWEDIGPSSALTEYVLDFHSVTLFQNQSASKLKISAQL